MNRLSVTLPFGLIPALLVGCPEHTSIDLSIDGGFDAAAAADWKVALEGLEGSLLSVWGTNEIDVWTVGGSLGNGGEALVLRFDGTTWRRVHPGGTETYWWVHGSGPNDVWLVGEKGRTTHWDGTKLEERETGTTATLFGVFAFAPDDAWAVGGIPEDPSQPKDVVLHWDGTAWKKATLPEATNVALFKIWGGAKDDLYAVGENGVIWHQKGGAWKREAKDLAQGRLTTVTGCDATHVYAVGSRNVLASDGTTWTRVVLPDSTAVTGGVLLNDANGVACAPPGARDRPWGNVVVVGGGSLKLRLAAGQWTSDFGAPPLVDLHGAWVDPTGVLWGAGGNFNATPKQGASRGGVLARYSERTIATAIAP